MFGNSRKELKVLGTIIGYCFVGAAVSYITIWQIHFSSGGNTVKTLPNGGYFQASEQYKTLIDEKRTSDLTAFPMQIHEHLSFLGHYTKGVPSLNLAKDDENGSPWFLWPVGGRTISYRWQSAGNYGHRYLYLAANPVSFLLGLLAVFLGCCLVITRFITTVKQPLKQPVLLVTTLMLYCSYMIAISQISRVMYLYHYFLPLVFSFIVLGLLWNEIDRLGPLILDQSKKIAGATIVACLVFIGFQYIRPLTYYEPISKQSLQAREVFNVWDITCAGCKREGYLATPFPSQQ